jgi:hypothetical protein
LLAAVLRSRLQSSGDSRPNARSGNGAVRSTSPTRIDATPKRGGSCKRVPHRSSTMQDQQEGGKEEGSAEGRNQGPCWFLTFAVSEPVECSACDYMRAALRAYTHRSKPAAVAANAWNAIG